MITATAWIPAGTASRFPTRFAATDEELAQLHAQATEEAEAARAGYENAKNNSNNGKNEENNGNDDEDDIVKQYNLDAYDEEEEDEGRNGEFFRFLWKSG
jgi:hypothetical protein